MIYLVMAILVIEILRTIISISDNKGVRQINKTVTERIAAREAEINRMRKEEIETLVLASKGCQILADIITEIKSTEKNWKEINK